MIKIDIEGFENDLFDKNMAWLDDVAAVLIEPHDWLFPGEGSSLKFQKAMASQNFEILVSTRPSYILECECVSNGAALKRLGGGCLMTFESLSTKVGHIIAGLARDLTPRSLADKLAFVEGQ